VAACIRLGIGGWSEEMAFCQGCWSEHVVGVVLAKPIMLVDCIIPRISRMAYIKVNQVVTVGET
jgi:hypothetical protein